MVSFSRKVNGIDVSWEIGAGRIHSSHTLIRNVIRRVGCNLVPIPAATGFALGDGVIGASPFESGLLDPLKKLDSDVLRNNTLREITNKTYGEKCQEIYFLFVNTNRAFVEFAGRI